MIERPSARVAAEAVGGGISVDDDFASLPRPPRRARTLSLALMALAGIAAAVMAILLAGDVRYALRSSPPLEIGAFKDLMPRDELRNAYVQGAGTLQLDRALVYRRPLEPDAFQLAPVVGNDRWWVEMRAPSESPGMLGRGPTSFVGRLVPAAERGFRRNAPARLSSGAPGALPENAWVLLDGVTPESLRWTLLLFALFAAFTLFCLINIVRILRPVRN